MNKLLLTKPLEKKKSIKMNNNKGIYYDKVNVPFNFNDPLFKILYFLHNNNVKTIYNVFQPIYIDEPTTGFGDFIRGCYFLMQFCEEKKFNYGFRINNHPIKYLLKNFEYNKSLPDIITNSIKKHISTNFKEDKNFNIYGDFLYFLKDSKIHNFSLYIHTTAYPDKQIQQKHKDIIKQMLIPSNLLEKKILYTFNELKLTKYNFATIHIRLGDKYFKKDDTKEDNFIIVDENIKNNCAISIDSDEEDEDQSKIDFIIEFIENYTKNNIKNNKFDLLLIADNEHIKKILVEKFPFIKITLNKIVHTRENNEEAEDLINTMIEFYLMSYSKEIHAFSIYEHGSGFSRWCAETYNIPYKCTFLNF